GMTVREFYGILQSWLGDRILVEKTPQYTYNMNVLRRAEEYFDSSLYIHLVRNPYAVIHSYENARLDQLFKYEHRFSSRELGELLWIICHQNILEFLETIPPARKFRLKYEEMVSNPPLVIGQMCRHFGLEFEPRMLDVYGDAGNRMTDGIYAESKMLGDVKFFTHSSIDTGSVEKWKQKYKMPFLGETAVELAKYFGYSWEQTHYSRIEPVVSREHYQLSPSQKRLWILDRLEEEESHIAYNVPGAYWLTGNLNIGALEKTYETVIKRHEILRTTFIIIDGEPRQKIHDFVSLGFKWEHIDLRDDKDRIEKAKILAKKEAASPFDLEHGPLLRTKTIRLEQDQYLFLFTMHHIISDGWSMNVLIREILALYDAYQNNRENPLPPLQFQYRDYSEWLNGDTMRRVLEKQEKYWLEEFAGEVPVLNLPLDYSRPAVMSFAGNAAWFGFDKGQTEALSQLARSEGVSIFIVLAAVFNVFLAKISDQEDIIIGTPTAGRHHPSLENILGMLVNTLALRSFPNGKKHFIQYLQQFRTTVWEAFENQDYPFETLVEKVVIKRDTGRNPLFDVMFSLKGAYGAGTYQSSQYLPGQEIKSYAAEHVTSKFDLSFIASEQEGNLYFSCEYCTKLFREETIQRFFEYLTNAAVAITQNPLSKISEIEIIPAEEKDHILYTFNNTGTAYPVDKSIHRLFAEQAEQTPDAIALVARGLTKGEEKKRRKEEKKKKEEPFGRINAFGGVHLSYRELNQQSDRLARLLIAKGITVDNIVGIKMERSVEMIVSILGILKSGGAYLPIDPEYPMDRVNYMLRDSSARILINKSEIRNPKPETNSNGQKINDQNKNQNS
ncbi:MAG TPA: condensation domain-containing protein, partial [Candidatus Deferrimicrobium sp.]|nr:condensation domain-containing protein [Candidatus Deferrimicrobium sp.]